MIEPVLIDTGPLVAILYDKDACHTVCSACLNELTLPPITCWPVVTEAAHLLRRAGSSLKELLTLLLDSGIELVDLDSSAASWIRSYAERYSSLSPDLADVALMHIAEKRRIDTIFTLDYRDFSVFRTLDGRPLRIIPEL